MATMRRVLALLLIAACGDDEFTGLPDGPTPPDGTPDTPTEGLVKLTVTDSGLPRMGIKVYFQNADSSLVSATMTDVSGVASAVMEAGGFVTAIDPFPIRTPQLGGGLGLHEIKSFAGVKPLDELVLDRAAPLENTTVNVSLIVNPDANVPGASYALFAPCLSSGIGIGGGSGSGGSGSVGGPVTFTGCGTTTDITITASDNTGVRSSIHKANVTLTEGEAIDLTDLTYAASVDATWQYTNVPAAIASIDVVDVLVTPRGPQFLSFDGAIIDAGTGITQARKRPVIDGSVQVVLSDLFGTPNSRHTVLEWGPTTTAYSKSLTDVLLSDYATLPVYDVATKSVTWTVDAAATPDLAIIRTPFFREAASSLDWDWEIAAPIGAEVTVRYPVLPAPDDQFNPIATDSVFNVDRLTTAKVPGGYDAVRNVVLSLDGDPNTGLPLDLVAGATGTVVSEDIRFAKGKRTPTQFVPFAAKVYQAYKARHR